MVQCESDVRGVVNSEIHGWLPVWQMAGGISRIDLDLGGAVNKI